MVREERVCGGCEREEERERERQTRIEVERQKTLASYNTDILHIIG